MENIVEFRIEGTLCRVVPEDEIVSASPHQAGDKDFAINRFQLVGNCALNGRRYLILCAAPTADPASDTEASPRDSLTPREFQVALLVANGYGNKQIAYRLKLSEWTVSSYLRRIFVKLGVRTRAAMVAKMMVKPSPLFGP